MSGKNEEKTTQQKRNRSQSHTASTQSQNLNTSGTLNSNSNPNVSSNSNPNISEKSGPPYPTRDPNKKPSLTKAERKAKFEQKQAQQAQQPQQAQQSQQKKGQQQNQSQGQQQNSNQPSKREARAQSKEVLLFSHLQQYNTKQEEFMNGVSLQYVHPSIVKLGAKYHDGSISGSNARCLGLINAVKDVIKDYVTPEDKTIQRDLESHIKPHLTYLNNCRSLSTSMKNFIQFLKFLIQTQTVGMSESEGKNFLIDKIEFFQERILFASKIISDIAVTKITDGDVILTYGSSSVVERALFKAHESGKSFRVIIVDASPKREGKGLLYRLVQYGLDCSYILINAIAYIMPEVTKVIIGAHAMMLNGSVISRAGTASVMIIANRFNVPTLVCCESYKFAGRALLDSICHNELGNPDLVAKGDPELTNWRKMGNLKLLNLMYDVTPIEFVDVVVTELGLIPPTSVPVILRETRAENNKNI